MHSTNAGEPVKAYPVVFTTDYRDWLNYAEKGDKFWESQITDHNFPGDLAKCDKWRGKELTLAELEEVIQEIGSIIFDGQTIEIYNDYRE